MRILGIDYGDSRVGISISDPFGWTAKGLETISWKGNIERVIERIISIVDEYKAEKIVVGFPKNMNGTIGPRGEKTQEFIDMLSKRVDPEIVKWDERLSTVAAHKIMNDTGVKAGKKRSIVDQVAAVYILQGYLDSIANK